MNALGAGIRFIDNRKCRDGHEYVAVGAGIDAQEVVRLGLLRDYTVFSALAGMNRSGGMWGVMDYKKWKFSGFDSHFSCKIEGAVL